MDLSTATPVEIDTALAEIYERYYAEKAVEARLLSFIKDMQKGIAKHQAGNASYSFSSYTPEALADLEQRYETSQEKSLTIMQETLPYESEYRRRPWTRFFLVKNNGGHIHSSMSCSTCFPTTQFGWLPEISGLTEAEAVKAHGAILCTVCYPSAPVEWTDRHDDSVCAGSGQYYVEPSRTGYYSGNWGTCPTCGERQTVSKIGKIRKHKKA